MIKVTVKLEDKTFELYNSDTEMLNIHEMHKMAHATYKENIAQLLLVLVTASHVIVKERL